MSRRRQPPSAPAPHVPAETRSRLLRLERQTVQRVEAELRRALKSLVIEAIDRVVATALRSLSEQLSWMGAELTEQPLPMPAPARLGRSKCCRVCGLSGTRNDKRLGPHHSREDHERWRVDRQGSRGATTPTPAPHGPQPAPATRRAA